MAKKGGDHNDFNTLPDRAGNARQAVGKLSNAFEELTRSGGRTHGAVLAVGGALGAIPTPASQVASVLVTVAGAFMKAAGDAAEFETKIKFRQWAKEAESFALGVEIAAAKVRVFNAAMFAGDSEAVSALKSRISTLVETANKLADTPEKVANISKLIRGLRQELEDLVKSEEKQVEVRTKANPLLAANVFLLKQQLEFQRELARIDLERRIKPKGFEDQQAEGGLAVTIATTKASEEAASAFSAEAQAASLLGSVAGDAFDQYANAMDRVIDGQNAFSKSAGRAMQNALAATLHSIGRQAAVEAGMEGARALAALATHRYADAGNHAAAAAAFLGVAAAAGVGAGAMSVKPSSGGRGSGVGGDSGGGSGVASGRGGPTINVYPIGVLDYDAARSLGAQLAQAFAEGG